jgi:hypothetical protein
MNIKLVLSVTVAVHALAGQPPSKGASTPLHWRLTDETSCAVEAVNRVSAPATLHLTIDRIADATQIKVQTDKQEQPVEDWINFGPHDSRSVAIQAGAQVQIRIDIPRHASHVPRLKTKGTYTSELICGKTRLTIETTP